MNIKRMISKIYGKFKLKSLKKQGVKLGKNISLTGKVRVGSEGYLVEIGDDVTIAGADILTHDGGIRIIRKLENNPNLKKQGKVIIKNNTFIGKNSIILPGITIGPNSIVGCGSVVTKNVPQNTVYAGNPAKYICSIDEYRKKCINQD